VRLALLNARLSSRVFLAWFGSMPRRALLGRMLSSFNLIVPQSDIVSGLLRGCGLRQVTRAGATWPG
jgi:3-deoxy-D-manno-octulosonic-acid transferase